ncbi:unnamed protein product [Mytilus coruscus]|uniref:Cysteine and tyrosine-rich protein 1 n=1 Tax=Mytilus coruscus TaxID=42192 RepID=A0A6J8EK19_MYTCO|nr:unnamed protein product [Mytilus coruscus]
MDGEWECALLELSFVPQFETPTRRVYFCLDFIEHTNVRGTTLPILQSARVLNEDIADIVHEKPIYLRVTRSHEILCAKCYTHIHSSYYGTYCSGYCSGLHGSQYCYNGNYVISGGAIAGLIIGVLVAAAIFVVIVVICIKGGCNKGRPGRVVTTTGTGIGTHVAVTNTSHNSGYMQPMNPYGYSAPPPPSYGMMYPQAQQVSPAYPPAPGVQQGYSAPAQPQYSSVYNQPVFGNLPRANISGGAIAGLIIGVLAAAAIFVVIVVICIKSGCNKGRPGRVVTTTGTGIGTHVAVTHTSHNPGYMQPMNPYGYSAPPPPAYGMMYPQAQQVSPAYPPAPGVQMGYCAPAQPQYSSVYNQPVSGNLPRANM